MRRVIFRIGATGAGALLALGLLAGPSTAGEGSDQERKSEQSNKVTCFEPEGKTQGRSLSDPDGTSNGGTDKPGCVGVADADKDGNNGCGNDADREDDNNGNCGGEEGQGPGTDTPGDQGPGDESDEPEGDDDTVNPETVEGDVNVQAAAAEAESGTAATEAAGTTAAGPAVTAADNTAPAAQTTTPASDTQVLGETLTAPDALPRTGAGVAGLALLGGALVGGGRLTVLARKLLRIG
ncbi:MAG TPA: hypothetical protein VJS45_06025 [Acidimicrobiia bacterium]|nr:hypothetical protein [Acidimicrobiia bacterium]